MNPHLLVGPVGLDFKAAQLFVSSLSCQSVTKETKQEFNSHTEYLT